MDKQVFKPLDKVKPLNKNFGSLSGLVLCYVSIDGEELQLVRILWNRKTSFPAVVPVEFLKLV